MNEAMARLGVRKKDSAGETVVYSRSSNGFAAALVAEFGQRTPSRAAIAQGMVQLDREPMDFLIAATDFAATNLGEPLRGDRITTAAGHVYEVAARDGQPAFQLSDTFGHRLRIRTMREA